MSLFSKAVTKAKQFIKDTSKTTAKLKRDFLKNWKRNYTGKKSPKMFEPGKLIHFNYDALDATKRFDKRPLVLSLGYSKASRKNFLGLNIHWLPESQRVLLASLIVEMKDKKGGKLDYEDVKPLIKKFKNSPILRMYKIRRVSNKVIDLPDDVFLRAASLNGEDWSQ